MGISRHVSGTPPTDETHARLFVICLAASRARGCDFRFALQRKIRAIFSSTVMEEGDTLDEQLSLDTFSNRFNVLKRKSRNDPVGFMLNEAKLKVSLWQS